MAAGLDLWPGPCRLAGRHTVRASSEATLLRPLCEMRCDDRIHQEAMASPQGQGGRASRLPGSRTFVGARSRGRRAHDYRPETAWPVIAQRGPALRQFHRATASAREKNARTRFALPDSPQFHGESRRPARLTLVSLNCWCWSSRGRRWFGRRGRWVFARSSRRAQVARGASRRLVCTGGDVCIAARGCIHTCGRPGRGELCGRGRSGRRGGGSRGGRSGAAGLRSGGGECPAGRSRRPGGGGGSCRSRASAAGCAAPRPTG